MNTAPSPPLQREGILPINKSPGKSTFYLVKRLRVISGIRKIGHCGTLDPFAQGVTILLIGSTYTKQSSTFLHQDKSYTATLKLGETTDTYDREGEITARNARIPTLQEIQAALTYFQGSILHTPPMFCAKKVNGIPLYKLARQGLSIPRRPVNVTITTTLETYDYPSVQIQVDCSKGTYIRSIAYEIGQRLQTGAHLTQLTRTRSGPFHLSHCLAMDHLDNTSLDYSPYLFKKPPLTSLESNTFMESSRRL